MKKNVVYIGIALLIGLFAGYLIFGSKTVEELSEKHDHTMDTSDQMWTCSMHPQIIQSESGDCPICGMDLIPAETNADGLRPDQFRMTENAVALANVQTLVIGENRLDSEMVKLSGKIEENEEANAVQVAYFGGRIERLFVNSTGEYVKNGQLLATIYSPELVASQQELLTALSLKKSQPELYKAVRNKLKLWKLSENQINQIEASGKVKENFPVYAKVSGTVASKMVEAGDYVKQGQILYKIADLSTVWASFDAYENQISLLKEGQKIKIKTKAYPNKDVETEISFIDPVLNTNTRTFKVRTILKNSNSIFKPGMFVEGMISVSDSENNSVITIPKSAVLWTGERSVVYVKMESDEPVFEMKEVTLGNANADSYQILDGLSNDEEIVINGTFTVDAAAQLQGKKSMMKRNEMLDKLGTENESEKVSLSGDFQKELMESLSTYFLLKDALVASNANDVSKFSEQMFNQLKRVNTLNLQPAESGYANAIMKTLAMIAKKEDLVGQRDHFIKLNEDLQALIKNLDHLSDEIYIQKCPMANNNKGATWLSKEKKIRNPYFGDQMLTCGSVIDSLGKG
ncbi:efflux RND transporter periplasmic adaptor subunit [Aquimarina rubra]|uniref:Efflux RND transporter periplasmic adaptor subunit n=1 Tax=Aquimarina rubra TaxID=1920033 RepID=A0ABW5LGS7_9FLAO